MKTVQAWFLMVALLFVSGCTTVTESSSKIKVLVVTGGHGFEQESFFRMFSDNEAITFTADAHAKTNATAYEREDFLTYDVVVFYDMMRNITEHQKEQFKGLIARGKGLVILHHALVAYSDWPDYERILGGRYTEPNPQKPGTVTDAVGWKHDEEVPVVIVATNHPITAGLKDFTIHDEIYWGYRVSKDSIPLITTTHPKSGKPLGWYRKEGKSRVVYLQLGHGPEAFADANYRKLLAQSIRWTAKR
jgi:type 1 glutamine amidotransferase